MAAWWQLERVTDSTDLSEYIDDLLQYKEAVNVTTGTVVRYNKF
jgi:hypothetical protein